MVTRCPSSSFCKTVQAAMLAAATMAGTASPALAGPHRVRFGADLVDHMRAGSHAVEVIVEGDRTTVDRVARHYNLVVKRYLRKGGVVVANAGQLAALQDDDELDHLSGNIRYRTLAIGAIDPIDEGIGADQVWAGAGHLPKLSGKGVTVAVIDSGIDLKHNAFKGSGMASRVLTTVDFTGGNGVDLFGHGTHVAAIIAGRRGVTRDTSLYQGVAPGAYLVNLRVLGNDGTGEAGDVIEAIDWAIEHRQQYNIRVINLSLGAPVVQPYRDDPVCAAVERAVSAGIFVVAAAGNFGQTADGTRILGGVTSPGNSPYAATVGALDTKGTAARDDDEVAAFSSSGPTRFDLVMKPDVVAPGRRVTSAEAAGSELSVNFPDQHIAGNGPNAYIRGSGTSMAAAFVSGAAAVLFEERPSLQPLTVKAALQMTSTFLPEAGLVQGGTGSLNLLAAAEYVLDGDLSDTTIADEPAAASRLVIAPVDQVVSAQGANRSLARHLFPIQKRLSRRARNNKPSSFIKSAADSVIWGESDSVIWGESDSVIWGESDSVIWGESDSVIWGESDSVIWGESDSVIWGESDSVIWRN
jgi:serine protease AprX